MTLKYYLGLDGGATKNEVAVMDSEGRILACVRGRGAHVGARISRSILAEYESLIESACRAAGISRTQIAFYSFGICGVDFPDEFQAQKKSLIKSLGIKDQQAVLVNDGIVALWGGTRAARAVCLQVGTGYTAAYRSAYGEEESFDQYNCGVVLNLRKDIYTYAARSWDGREVQSILPQLLMDYFEEKDPSLLIKKLNRHRFAKPKVANALGVLTVAVKKKDELALRLVEGAAETYARDIDTMIERIGGGRVDVVLGGGVLLNSPPLLMRRIGERVRKKHPKATVHKPRLSPCTGACFMAAFHDGAEMTSLFQKTGKRAQPE